MLTEVGHLTLSGYHIIETPLHLLGQTSLAMWVRLPSSSTRNFSLDSRRLNLDCTAATLEDFEGTRPKILVMSTRPAAPDSKLPSSSVRRPANSPHRRLRPWTTKRTNLLAPLPNWRLRARSRKCRSCIAMLRSNTANSVSMTLILGWFPLERWLFMGFAYRTQIL